MDWKVLCETQEILDDRINDERGLAGQNLMQERMLALLVEIGELANETRCFKFWSSKPASDKEIILEEFVDCMHFLLSIGNHSGFSDHLYEVRLNGNMNGSVTDLFYDFFHSVVEFRTKPSSSRYLDMWDHFMSIGTRLGFRKSEIYDSYLSKNEVNHERQSEGY